MVQAYPELAGPLNNLFHILLLLALFSKPSHYRKLFFIPILAVAFFRIFYIHTGDIFEDFFTTQAIAIGITQASDYIFLTDVQRELRMKDQTLPAYELSSWQRLRWAFILLCSSRGVGWNHEPRGVVPARPKGLSKLQFIRRQVIRIIWFLFLFDLGRMHDFWNPTTVPSGTFPEIIEQNWLQVSLFSWALITYAGLSGVHALMSVIVTCLGLSKQENWPPLFGSILDAYTIQRLWGRTWHQMLRRPLSQHGKFVAHQILKFPPKTTSAYLAESITAFTLSGLSHLAGEYGLNGRLGLGMVTFFMSQAVAVILETLLAVAAKQISLYKPRKADHPSSTSGRFSKWRILGYAWVMTWVALTGPILMRELLGRGLGRNMVHFSLILGTTEGRWLPRSSL